MALDSCRLRPIVLVKAAISCQPPHQLGEAMQDLTNYRADMRAMFNEVNPLQPSNTLAGYTIEELCEAHDGFSDCGDTVNCDAIQVELDRRGYAPVIDLVDHVDSIACDDNVPF